MLGMKCVNFGCWSYTGHKSGLCSGCRAPKPPIKQAEGKS